MNKQDLLLIREREMRSLSSYSFNPTKEAGVFSITQGETKVGTIDLNNRTFRKYGGKKWVGYYNSGLEATIKKYGVKISSWKLVYYIGTKQLENVCSGKPYQYCLATKEAIISRKTHIMGKLVIEPA
jgi:hypothetical protein